jgi:magnesium-transporting ATPase (P-type)
MELQAQECQVLRDGRWQTIEAINLVPGDIIRVKTGECVPADCRVAEITSIALQVEQAALTGESVSVSKSIDRLGDDAATLQDQKNIIFSSTIVSNGDAIAIVAYTGMKTAIGSVHSEVQAAKEDEEDTPLKQKIDEFGDMLAKVIAVICILVWGMNFNNFWDPMHGTPFKGCIYYFKIAVALAVAAIPEGLPAVITTCLALGTRKMAENNCIVRRLPSVETLGCTSVICSDKTGTLTQNLMSACKFGYIMTKACDFAEFDVEEKAYSPEPMIPNFGNIMKHSANAKTMALVCALNSRAELEYKDSAYHLVGQPTEGALSVLAEKLGNSTGDVTVSQHEKTLRYKDYLNSVYETVATLDFSSKRKTMSTVVK